MFCGTALLLAGILAMHSGANHALSMVIAGTPWSLFPVHQQIVIVLIILLADVFL